MKKYKFKFNKSILIVGIIGVLVAIACMVMGAIRFLNLIKENINITIYNYITLVLVEVLPVLFIVIVVSAYFNSYYKITDTEIILRWGIIVNKFRLSDVKEVKCLTVKNKLELLFSDDTYFVVVTDKRWYEDFVDELKSKRPDVLYVVHTEESKD